MSSASASARSTVTTVVDKLKETLGRSSFQVFGGAALDLLDNPDAQVRDLDIALPLDSEVAIAVLARLIELGGELSSPFRKYWIGCRFPVLMVTAQVNDLLLDLNFLDAVDQIGCFDIDAVRWRAPDCDIFDPLDARRALHKRRAVTERPAAVLRRLPGR
jgi:hypothetical protein